MSRGRIFSFRCAMAVLLISALGCKRQQLFHQKESCDESVAGLPLEKVHSYDLYLVAPKVAGVHNMEEAIEKFNAAKLAPFAMTVMGFSCDLGKEGDPHELEKCFSNRPREVLATAEGSTEHLFQQGPPPPPVDYEKRGPGLNGLPKCDAPHAVCPSLETEETTAGRIKTPNGLVFFDPKDQSHVREYLFVPCKIALDHLVSTYAEAKNLNGDLLVRLRGHHAPSSGTDKPYFHRMHEEK